MESILLSRSELTRQLRGKQESPRWREEEEEDEQEAAGRKTTRLPLFRAKFFFSFFLFCYMALDANFFSFPLCSDREAPCAFSRPRAHSHVFCSSADFIVTFGLRSCLRAGTSLTAPSCVSARRAVNSRGHVCCAAFHALLLFLKPIFTLTAEKLQPHVKILQSVIFNL